MQRTPHFSPAQVTLYCLYDQTPCLFPQKLSPYKVWSQTHISALFLPIRKEPVGENSLFIALCRVQLAINADETQLPKAQYAAAGL